MAVGRYYQQNQAVYRGDQPLSRRIERYQITTHVPEALHRLVESYLSLASRARPRRRRRCWATISSSDWYQDSYYLMTGEGTPAPVDEKRWFFASSDRACMLVSLSIRDFVLTRSLPQFFAEFCGRGRRVRSPVRPAPASRS